MRKLLWIAGVPAVLILLIVAVGAWRFSAALPATDGEAALPGLAAAVTVNRDGPGIVTIRAENEEDAYRALGYVHAQDRFWQMEMTRRLGQGRLAELVGPGVIDIDRYTRTFGFYRLAEAQIPYLESGTRAALTAYADGVNAWMAESGQAMPAEVQLLFYDPEPWTVADSLVWIRMMAFQLSTNMRGEQFRARLADHLDAAQIADFLPGARSGDPITLPPGSQALLEAMPPLPAPLRSESASNAWALDGSRTGTGRPILANDPHLGLTAPNLWYFVTIETPTLTLSGVTAPGTPFHILGHNGTVAWGMTTTYADTQDLFVETPTGDGNSYETPSGQRPFETRTERISVRFGETETLTVRATRHGPVISDLWSGGQGPVMALAFPGFTERDTTPDALYHLNRARSPDEVKEAMRLHIAPVQSLHYADINGNIGVIAPGRIPIRRVGNGLIPVDGASGSYDWTGFIPFEDLPQWDNPADGVIRNANNQLVGPDFPFLISAEWPPAFRARRLEALLEGQRLTGVEDSIKWQMDVVSEAARALLPLMLEVPTETADMDRAVTLLRGWDGTMALDRPEPLLYSTWMMQLASAVSRDELGEAATTAWEEREVFLIRVLTERPAWCDDIRTELEESCAEMLSTTLQDSLRALADTYGSDMAEWRWGDAHIAHLEHRVLDRIPLLGRLASLTIPTPGGDHTLNRGQSSTEPGLVWRHIHGPGYRAVYDLSNLGNSRFSLAGGQSGHLMSPNYGNLMEDWRDGRYFRSDGRRDDIPEAPAEVLTLTPR